MVEFTPEDADGSWSETQLNCPLPPRAFIHNHSLGKGNNPLEINPELSEEESMLGEWIIQNNQ